MSKEKKTTKTLALSGLTKEDKAMIKKLNSFVDDEERVFPPKSPIYIDYSLEQVAYITKKDEDAKNEYINRVSPFITSCVIKEISRKHYIDEHELSTHLFDACLEILNEFHFDFSVPFIHYFKARIKKTISYFEAAKARSYKTAVNPVKISLSNLLEDSLMDSVYANAYGSPDQAILILDLNKFISTLPLTDQHIVHFLKLGYSAAQIADIFECNPSLIARRVKKIRELVNDFLEKLKKNN